MSSMTQPNKTLVVKPTNSRLESGFEIWTCTEVELTFELFENGLNFLGLRNALVTPDNLSVSFYHPKSATALDDAGYVALKEGTKIKENEFKADFKFKHPSEYYRTLGVDSKAVDFPQTARFYLTINNLRFEGSLIVNNVYSNRDRFRRNWTLNFSLPCPSPSNKTVALDPGARSKKMRKKYEVLSDYVLSVWFSKNGEPFEHRKQIGHIKADKPIVIKNAAFAAKFKLNTQFLIEEQYNPLLKIHFALKTLESEYVGTLDVASVIYQTENIQGYVSMITVIAGEETKLNNIPEDSSSNKRIPLATEDFIPSKKQKNNNYFSSSSTNKDNLIERTDQVLASSNDIDKAIEDLAKQVSAEDLESWFLSNSPSSQNWLDC